MEIGWGELELAKSQIRRSIKLHLDAADFLHSNNQTIYNCQ